VRLELAWLLVVAAALLAVYLPGLGNALVYDDGYLTEGLFTEYGSPLPLRVRMLSYGSFVWIQPLLGDGWWKQRGFNLLVHAGVTVALWALYREILRHIAPSGDEADAAPYYRSPALGVAIGFFALNPVAVYAVAYLIQRSIVMATLFSVLSLWLFARALRTRRYWLFAAALACYVLAIASKEHAALLPVAAIPLYVVVSRPPARRFAALCAGSALLVAVAAVILYLRYGDIVGKPFDEYSNLYLDQLARLQPDIREHSWGLSIMNEAWLFFRYGFDWIVPWSGWMSINLRPPFPVRWLSFPQILGVPLFVALLAGGSILVARFRDGRALLGLSLLFPALLFGTEFATVWVQDPFALYRSYLWAIGIPGIVFFALHGPAPRVVFGIGAVVGGLLVWQSIDRVFSLADPETVWSDAIEKLPSDPRSVGRWFLYLNRGSAYVDQGAMRLALRDFEASAGLGDQGMGIFNIGAVLSAQGRQREALAAFDRAEKEGYKLYNLPFQRGLALFALGQVEEGYRQMRAAVAAGAKSPIREVALMSIARAGMQLGHKQESLEALRQVVAAEPRNNEARYLLGMAWLMNGDAVHAREVLDPLVREAPTANAYYGRALANRALARKAEALSDIDNALRLAPGNANFRDWREKIRAMP
jgi:hypothetical protein